MLLRWTLIALTLAGSGSSHFSQNAAAKGEAGDVQSKIAGVWRGHSECADKK